MVIMFLSVLLIEDSAPYNVVVFPLPVGPVTRKIPCAALISSLKSLSLSFGIPRSDTLIKIFVLSSSLNTTLSPNAVGIVDTLISIFLSPILISIGPSWGSLFSAIFISAITLIRDMSADCICFCGEIIS